MQKSHELYDARNKQKKYIEFEEKTTHQARTGQFSWYREGMNIGNEISKDGKFKRVCLVLKTNNKNGLLLVIPLTTKYHKRMDNHYFHISSYDQFEGLKESRGLLNQVKFIDKKRLSHKVCMKVLKKRVVDVCIGKYVKSLFYNKKDLIQRGGNGSD